MAYSKSPVTFKRIQPLLDRILDLIYVNQGESGYSLAVMDARKTAYKINEGIAYAIANRMGNYILLRERVSFSVSADNKSVLIVPRLELPTVMQSSNVVYEDDEERNDSIRVVEKMLTISRNAGEVRFTNANLSHDELVILYKWTTPNGWFIIPAEDALVLTKHDFKGIAWTPDE